MIRSGFHTFLPFLLILCGLSNRSFGQTTEEKIDQLNETAWQFMSVNQDSVLYYCHQADSLSKQVNYAAGLGFSNVYKGWVAFYRSEFPVALQFYRAAEDTATSIGHQQLLGRAQVSTGSYYTYMGDLVQGMHYYQLALKALKEAGDKEWENYAYNNIGVNYEQQTNYQQAGEYYHKALHLFEERNDSIGMVLSYNNIANCYQNENQLDSAIYYTRQALDGAEKIGFQRIVGASLAHLADYAVQQNRFEDADRFIEQAQAFYTTQNDLGGEIEIAFIAAALATKKGAIQQAINLLKAKQAAVDSVGVIGFHAKLNYKLSQLYAQQNKYQQSNEHLMRYVQWNDSLLNVKGQEQINELEVRYQTQEKILEIANLNQEKQLMTLEAEQRQKDEAHQKRIRNWGFAIGGIVLLLLSIIIGIIYSKNKKINRVNTIISQQKTAVEEQKQVIETSHREITDSITYAKGLQDALLPQESAIHEAFSQSFVYFKPKDVVSGDFYWFEQENGYRFIAVADCTGHGVPGALVSVVCSTALNRAVNEFNLTDPAAILSTARTLIIETFARNGETVKDGMDIALCAIDPQGEVRYSGANNPLWIVRSTDQLTTTEKEAANTLIEGEYALIELKGNKQPVGRHEKMQDFVSHPVQLKPNDTLYLFTDGFADQFGGLKGKKYKYKPFKRFLITLSTNSSAVARKQELETEFNRWKGNAEQVDDICILGFSL